MTWADLLIVAILVISVVSAFADGIFVELFSLAGIVCGLLIAAVEYGWLAARIVPVVRSTEAADLIAFLLIALAVMLAAGLVGRLLRKVVHTVGLGFADRLLGALFGLVRGCIVVTLMMMAVAAFYPGSTWLENSRLAPPFLAAAHEVSHVTPAELGQKVRQGVALIDNVRQRWLPPGETPH